MDGIAPAAQVFQGSVEIGSLHQNTGHFVPVFFKSGGKGFQFHSSGRLLEFYKLNIQIAEVTVEYSPGMGVNGSGHQHDMGLSSGVQRHGTGFRCGGMAVVERGVGYRETGYLCNGRLKLKQYLENPLRHFRLVGGVGCNELRASHQMRNNRRDGMVVLTAAGEQQFCLVHIGHSSHFREHIGFGHGVGHVQSFGKSDRLRNIGE